MSAEIVNQLVEQAGPYLSAAVGAYGAGVFSRAQDAAVDAAADATASLGQRILRAVWHRRDDQGRAALESAVREAAEEPDEDAAGALRQLIKRALREDTELAREVAELLPAQGGVTVNVSGTRAIGAQHIDIAVSGDHATIHPPQP
ncbi:hypothetical protein OHT57_29985 [Streptomyces sp. NBC_00285]|uniref:hypothetical protein n=1 Tax=Streptomyces sp. NBC_00285 TaxID=2975700 RepID=UPI002E29DDCF|nr:hypothetical protein [Streptomyces sp. NBC_00285]